MTHGSLFNGIGGFQLAAEWMGWTNIFSCEIDKFCNKVTKHHFPNCIQHEDIKTTDFSIYRGRIDIVTGGDPCQPHSKAGKQLGFNDARYLWPEMLRAITELRPNWIVNENVRGSINTGLLDQKISDLEDKGYACWPPLLIPSGAQNIHERYRVWLVAHADENAINDYTGKIQGKASEGQKEEWQQNWKRLRSEPGSILSEHNWKEIASKLCRSINGLSNRLDRNGAIGNAIDPRIAYEIFKAIELTQ
jgi:DNA (cytosine-5)-methyltransferase 1